MTDALILACSLPTGRRGYRPHRREPARGVQTRPAVGTSRIPRVSRLMALALHLDELLRTGVVANQAALAQLGHVSRARISHIQSLLHLAPDLQERLLFLPPVTQGRDPIHLRQLLPLAARLDWREQRRLWQELTDRLDSAASGGRA